MFLPGEHTLDGGVLAVANIGRFAMLAKDTSTSEITTSITCSSPGSFVLVNISKVEIRALDFISCGIHPPVPTSIESHHVFIALMRDLIANFGCHSSAVYTSMDVFCNSSGWTNTTCRVPTVMVSSVPNFRVLNCSVKSSYLPFFIDHSQAIFHDLRLENNTGDYGGGLCIVDSTVNLNSTFIVHNTAEIGGGGIHAQDSHIVFQNIILKSNTATYGGGLIVFNSTINFEGDSTFKGNSGKTDGCGVCATESDSNLVFQTVRVESNTAMYGGGFHVFDSTIKFTADSSFISNSAEIDGGGVYATNSLLVFQNVKVESNTASYGGGLVVFSSTINFEGDSTFVSNYAEIYGGGIDANDDSQLVFQSVKFENNTATCGGGFHVSDSTINFEGDSTFVGNSAEIYGGGIDANDNSQLACQSVRVENNTATYGGGFHVFSSMINFEGNSIFIGNSGEIDGGAVYATSSSHLVFQNVRVENNTAMYGGGLTVLNSTINSKGDSTFIGNLAKSHGGGVYADEHSHLVFQNVRVENNTASYGGGLTVFNSTINFEGDSSFIANLGEFYGGGVYAAYNSLLVFQNVKVESSTASYGGGIIVFSSTINFEGDSTFVSNYAEISGGGVHAADNSHLVFQNVKFENNTATYGGGFHVFSSMINFEGNSIFIGNSGEIDGGAVYATSSSHLVFQNVRVENNTAMYGGGLTVLNSTINSKGDSTFIGNLAKSHGGGVYADEHSHLVFQNVRVENNTASYGGGLTVFNSTINFEGDSSFIANLGEFYGGGVYAAYNSLLVFQNVKVESNTASYGGGLVVFSSTINFEGDSTFVSNYAEIYGGGIDANDDSQLVFQSVKFENNTATCGGGFHVSDSTINFEGDSTFVGNSAEIYGGGIDANDNSQLACQSVRVENNTATYGGGFHVFSSMINFEGNSIFIGNSGEIDGGAVYATSSSHLVFQNVRVENNTAMYGGGLTVLNSTINSKGDSTFIGNLAKSHGGGVYADEHSHLVFQNVRVENNTASYGGGLTVFNSTINFEGDISFIANLGEFYGGGVYAAYNSLLVFQNVKVESNTASYGGGIIVFSSTINFEGDSTFVSNYAEISGGGVHAADNSHLVFQNVRVENNTASYGGGLTVFNSTINFEGDSSFIANLGEFYGGGVYAAYNSLLVFQNVKVESNTASYGGGFRVYDSTINLMGNSSFISNSGEISGGGVYATDNSHLVFQNLRVENNTASYGGGLTLFSSTINFEGDTTFIINSGEISGGGLYANNKSHLVFQNVRVENNTATYGGGITLFSSTIKFRADSTFLGNSAEISGGGVDAHDNSVLVFQNVTVTNICGDLYGARAELREPDHPCYMYNSSAHFERKTTFKNNSAKEFGGGIAAVSASLTFNIDVTFHSNNARVGGAIYGDSCSIATSGSMSLLNNSAWYGGAMELDASQLNVNGNSSFVGNSADHSNGYGGAINSVHSNLTFNGSIAFINNTATYGGGLALSADSTMYLLPNNTNIYFERNDASRYGGAIFIQDDPFSYCITDPMANYFRGICFIQVAHGQYCHYPTAYRVLRPTVGQDWGIQLVFDSNFAMEAGSVLYGGTLDRCGFCDGVEDLTIGAPFDTIASISDPPSNISVISSSPFCVCFCNDSHLDCSQRLTAYSKYPGETFSFPVVAVGQRSGTVPALINTEIAPTGVTIHYPQHIQQANKSCTPLNYTTISNTNASVAFLTLFAEGLCRDQGDPLQIEVHLRSCPEGFALSDEGICTCEERLQKYTTKCDINGRSIEHVGEFWVGYDNHSRGLILHPHCPFDYCKPGRFSFTLTNPDMQCDHNRAGDLCGACQPGFSIILGSSQCSRCSNEFLALVIAFGFAGLALVTLLFICKLTVAAGTFSGLLFYANIIAANQTAFFPPGETNVLTIFIAWLNLDLGIKICFFDGMDTYSKTWLQFAFPFYIWLLVGMVVVITRYSQLAARIIGNTNPVSVLATLFLLSYTKLLRTMIAVFSLTTLEYPDKTVAVWVHDGNIAYLDTTDAKHISLFLASLLVFLFLFLPYTLVLIFGQCIQARSNHKMLWWANNTRFRSFLDAYNAPYKNSHRYWIGLLLMVRFVLFIISAISDISSPQDPSVNLLVINITTFVLLVWALNTGGMYKKWYLNALESSFIFNLAVISATTLYIKLAGGNQAAVVYTSASIAFTTFIGIVCYHIQQRLSETRMWRLVLAPKFRNIRRAGEPDTELLIVENQPNISPPPPPTYSVVDIREPLDLITDH